ncbi:MAG: hypothetical protein MUP76_04960 [Acidimicrobiia bacterium]|nr:hypothetical protein [Acidimicrobiia bacterium]
MADFDWPGFYEALCGHGPSLLEGIDDETREIISLTTETDAFWSEGLVEVLAEGAARDDLRSGVLAAVDIWRESVLTVLAEDYGIELDWDGVTVDSDHPGVDALVAAATTV